MERFILIEIETSDDGKQCSGDCQLRVEEGCPYNEDRRCCCTDEIDNPELLAKIKEYLKNKPLESCGYTQEEINNTRNREIIL